MRLKRFCVFSAVPLLLSGCASLPTNGPTTNQILHAQTADNALGFRIVDIDPAVVKDINRMEEGSAPSPTPFLALDRAGTVNTVGPGDILSINVFEVGVTLFGGAGGSTALGADNFDPGAKNQAFSGVVVAEDGTIRLPYLGRIAVAGRTPAEIEHMIETGLRSKSQSPQALVSVRENVVNTVYVSGAVNRPGRFPLSLARERLLDALAVSGGVSGPSDSMIVRFTRGSQSVETRLSAIRTGSPLDLKLLPGDRIELLQRPKTFSVFGAAARVAQIPFDIDHLSVVEALAKVGGPNDSLANPRGVFLFRYTPDGLRAPVIYRFDMMKPTNYFLAQDVEVRDKDILYISNSPANLPTKFIGLINQLFAPVLTAKVLTQ